jgi:hypothetical protein
VGEDPRSSRFNASLASANGKVRATGRHAQVSGTGQLDEPLPLGVPEHRAFRCGAGHGLRVLTLGPGGRRDRDDPGRRSARHALGRRRAMTLQTRSSLCRWTLILLAINKYSQVPWFVMWYVRLTRSPSITSIELPTRDSLDCLAPCCDASEYSKAPHDPHQWGQFGHRGRSCPQVRGTWSFTGSLRASRRPFDEPETGARSQSAWCARHHPLS